MPNFLNGPKVSWTEFILMPNAVGRLNNSEHFINNAVSNTNFMIKEWY
jgi:hypothetical protein